MKEIQYADRLINITVHNGMVRLQFGNFRGMAKNDEGKEVFRFEGGTQVVVPLNSFVEAVGMQQGFLDKLKNVQADTAKGDSPSKS